MIERTMPATIIAGLNAINRDFYATIADDFSATRGRAWQGWQDLLPHLPPPRHDDGWRVLDVGCGNGRWGVHLAQNGRLAHYDGIDNNATLLNHAQQSLAAHDGVGVRLIAHDAIINAGASLADTLAVPPAHYDVVGLFGVLHHVPDFQQRRALLQALAALVADGGVLVFAAWRFYDYERFRARLVDWAAYDAQHGTDYAHHVQTGDYLLDWRRGERALRYCHYVDDAEQDALCAATSGLREIVRYRADGQDNRANAYSVLA